VDEGYENKRQITNQANNNIIIIITNNICTQSSII